MHPIHHVTAIAGKARRNLSFYTEVLGLRLVKKTVNYDDPHTYHFYFGDEAGRPGTLMTFFPWEYAAPGSTGAGCIEETAFSIPEGALGYWMHRLLEKAVPHSPAVEQFGRKVIRFEDPDGTRLALVAKPGEEGEGIRGIESVTMTVGDPVPSAELLVNLLGYREDASDDEVCRFTLPGEIGATVLLRSAQEVFSERFGRGSVHHVAFRARDEEEQLRLAERLKESFGISSTEPKDRSYFRSIYFREPGGIIFEIATDGPGFTIDEPLESLGSELQLPPFLQDRRQEIESRLPEV
jgi:glyoxalase family protein